MMRGALSIEPVGERELRFTRTFDAPRALVWRTLTEPVLLKRWLGVFADWTMPVCEFDARVGGKYRFEWQSTAGARMGLGGEIKECVPPERLVATELFDDPWYPGGAVTTQVLSEHHGKTTLTLTVTYASKEARDSVAAGPASEGLAANYETLNALVITMAKEGK